MTREFDLNIERVLENWTVAHALREVIANALVEQALTGTAEPQIFADAEGRWHIRDWGRGLRYEHLTQNENKEKLNHPDQVVGKFGVGLKDALATFDRHRIAVVIRSRHGDITTGKQAKHGFDDIETLHALITEPADPGLHRRRIHPAADRRECGGPHILYHLPKSQKEAPMAGETAPASRYALSFTSGALLMRESVIAAPLYLRE